MAFEDRVLNCVDCGQEFLFTAGEQVFFQDKQFRNEPKRCRTCKAKRIAAKGRSGDVKTFNKIETSAVCSSCGRETVVPFRPSQGRPVFCRECFQQKRPAMAGRVVAG